MDMLKKKKQINDEGTTIYKRDVEAEATYLSEDLRTMQVNEEGKYDVESEAFGKSLKKYLTVEDNENYSDSDEYARKANKYRTVAGQKGKGQTLKEHANTYDNHWTSKRAKSFKAAAKSYEKASVKMYALNQMVASGTMDTEGTKYVDARIEILKLRLDGMLSAAEAKSYSDNDEKLRKAAAKVKIYTAMISVYNEHINLYGKQIDKLTRDLQKALAEYNRLLPKDATERSREKTKREQAEKKSNKEKAVATEVVAEAKEEKKEKKAEKKSDKSKATKFLDLSPEELEVEASKVINGEELKFMPHAGLLLDGQKVEITREMYEKARKNVDLKRTIAADADSMDKSLRSNSERDFIIVQTVLGAIKKRAFERRSGRGAEEALAQYVNDTAICIAINDVLRTGDTRSRYKFMVKDKSETKKGYANLVKDGLQNSVIDYDIVVRRGVDASAIGFMLGDEGSDGLSMEQLQNKVGDNINSVCTDKGVVSTSVVNGRGYNKELELVILCKKGSKCLDISHGNGTKSPDEEELCIAPDTKFIIKDSIVGADGKWKVYLQTVVSGDNQGVEA